jgi:hypothetical protein
MFNDNSTGYLLHKILGSNSFENILLGCLLDLSADDELVQHEVGLLKVENNVQLAHLPINQLVLKRNKQPSLKYDSTTIRSMQWKAKPSYIQRSLQTRHKVAVSVADPGCFIQDPDPTIFSSQVRIQTFIHHGSYMKSGMQTYFFLASYAFRSKVIVLVKKKSGIRDPEKTHPGSRWVKSTGSRIQIRNTGSSKSLARTTVLM